MWKGLEEVSTQCDLEALARTALVRCCFAASSVTSAPPFNLAPDRLLDVLRSSQFYHVRNVQWLMSVDTGDN
jgi:hypothetical protein